MLWEMKKFLPLQPQLIGKIEITGNVIVKGT